MGVLFLGSPTAEAGLEEALIERLGVLQRVARPLALRSDNGLVFSSRHYTATVRAYGLKQEFTTLYTPEQNGLMERFFRSLKEECIWQQRLELLGHVREAIGQWIRYYNEQRPHQALNYAAPSAHPALSARGVQKTGGHYSAGSGYPRRSGPS